MSSELVSRSEDLSRLVADGYDLEIRDGNLLIHNVPYVTADRDVDRGILISELSHNGQAAITPGSHEVWFAGRSTPRDHLGQELIIINQRNQRDFGGGITAVCSLSGKRDRQMPANYHDKMANYARLLSQEARAIDPAASPTSWPAHAPRHDDETVFRYLDSASSRAGITAMSQKLKGERIAIVGLGGTGSYILDLLAKTPVAEIHLYDDDTLFAHNAFRTPGAAPLSVLTGEPKKVDYLAGQYDAIHSKVVPHPVRVDETNVADLGGLSFVFVAVDESPGKRIVIDGLVERSIPFVDCGIGLHREPDNALAGTARVTLSTPEHHEHLAERIAYQDQGEDEYDRNIQTGDVNMLSAAMAVIRWKRLRGFYTDRKREFNSLYTVAQNRIDNGDRV
jgi:hypothetical protein